MIIDWRKQKARIDRVMNLHAIIHARHRCLAGRKAIEEDGWLEEFTGCPNFQLVEHLNRSIGLDTPANITRAVMMQDWEYYVLDYINPVHNAKSINHLLLFQNWSNLKLTQADKEQWKTEGVRYPTHLRQRMADETQPKRVPASLLKAIQEQNYPQQKGTEQC